MTISVLVDTNVLINQIKHPIDLETQLRVIISPAFELVMIPPILRELEVLYNNAKSIPKKKTYSLALDLAKKFKLISYTTTEEQTTDEAIVTFAKSQNAVILTNDNQLRQLLRQQKTAVVYLRQKKRLELDGFITRNRK